MKRNIVLILVCLYTQLPGQTVDTTYLNPGDSFSNLYITFKPAGEVKGLLLLLPGFSEPAFVAADETGIPEAADKKGLVTVIASLQNGPFSFYIDSTSQNTLDKLIPELQEKYKTKNKPFYLGGFSLGGSGVVKYAERAYSSSNLVRPVAVFAVDPPLDFERFYNSIVHQMNLSKAEFAKKEISYFVGGLRFTFQATPASNIRKYYEISPYSNSDTTFTAIKKLVNCPIMLITEPDILWQMENHHDDYYNLNSVDCAAAINVLKILGNRNAILVVTSGKGIRKKTGLRNPHSWSIADPAETMTWLTGF